MLERLRFPAGQSRGRRYPEPAHAYRNPFQRDRDRVVHSRAFRRLEAKMQVFAPGISDHFRNRLTHTIEVSQIARTAARVLGLDEDLTEALALAHDIGHPPFAHAGEEELNRQMKRYGDGFDHNLHALRIVESFEQRYARFPGLNLTFEVREGMVKHSHDFGPGEQPELDAYLPGLRPLLEAQLIDLADEIAYNAADLDDAFSAGMFSAGEIAECVPEYGAILAAAETQFPGATAREQFHEALRQLIDALVSGLIEATAANAERAAVADAEAVRRVPYRAAGGSSFSGECRQPRAQAISLHPGLCRAGAGGGPAALCRHDRRSVRLFHRRPAPAARFIRGAGRKRVAPPRGLRLHCRHDRRFLPAHARAGVRPARRVIE
jgi:dGTPase